MKKNVGLTGYAGELGALEDKSLLIIKELRDTHLLRDGFIGFYTNEVTSAEAYNYAEFIKKSLNSYISNNYENSGLSVTFESYINPNATDGKFAYICIQVVGNTTPHISNDIRQAGLYLANKTIAGNEDMLSNLERSTLTDDSPKLACLSDTISKFKASNGSKNINNKFSIGTKIDDEHQFPVKAYVEFYEEEIKPTQHSGLATVSGLCSQQNTISLRVANFKQQLNQVLTCKCSDTKLLETAFKAGHFKKQVTYTLKIYYGGKKNDMQLLSLDVENG